MKYHFQFNSGALQAIAACGDALRVLNEIGKNDLKNISPESESVL